METFTNLDQLNKLLSSMTPAEMKVHDERIAGQIAAQEIAEKRERYKKSGVPERYYNESFETYRTDDDARASAKKSAESFLLDVKAGRFASFVMIGNAGTGKTHLACALIREAGGQYRTAPDLVEELRRAKSFTASETEAQIIKHYGSVSLLVIDEIGRGIAETDEKYMLYQILNARYNTRKPTVLISNFSKADFLKYIGVAAVDRLVESAELVELNGNSYRQELRGTR